MRLHEEHVCLREKQDATLGHRHISVRNAIGEQAVDLLKVAQVRGQEVKQVHNGVAFSCGECYDYNSCYASEFSLCAQMRFSTGISFVFSCCK